MVAQPTLTPADIDALLNARHPEPRSLLGYHEFAREDDAPPRPWNGTSAVVPSEIGTRACSPPGPKPRLVPRRGLGS